MRAVIFLLVLGGQTPLPKPEFGFYDDGFVWASDDDPASMDIARSIREGKLRATQRKTLDGVTLEIESTSKSLKCTFPTSVMGRFDWKISGDELSKKYKSTRSGMFYGQTDYVILLSKGSEKLVRKVGGKVLAEFEREKGDYVIGKKTLSHRFGPSKVGLSGTLKIMFPALDLEGEGKTKFTIRITKFTVVDAGSNRVINP